MPALATEPSAQAVHEHVATLARERPALEPLVQAFGLVQAAAAASRALLAAGGGLSDAPGDPGLLDLASLEPDVALLEQGVPLLGQAGPLRMDFHLATVAPLMLGAAAEAFPALAPVAAGLEAALSAGPGAEAMRRTCAQAMNSGDRDALAVLARRFDAPFGVLAFLLECLGRPALERAAAILGPKLQETPWTIWNRGRCPVCGGAPSMSLLQLGPQEPTEYLKNVSAQRWLCCSGCAHTWRFARTMCPACGHDEQQDREYFHVQGNADERVELCKRCNHYLLTMDVRDRLSAPDHRLAPLGLVHLDMLAQRRGYAPLAGNLWNLPEMAGFPDLAGGPEPPEAERA